MRIIAGRWRGRRLRVPRLAPVRPTPDRVRETLFNWLAPELPGRRCLDLFAGTGALGLEALSRDAGFTLLVERHGAAAAALRRTLRELGLGPERARALQADALALLRRGPETWGGPFAVVFLDPPFAAGLHGPCLHLLRERGWLAPGALVYVEAPAREPLPGPEGWSAHREGRSGEVRFALLRPPPGAPLSARAPRPPAHPSPGRAAGPGLDWRR